MESRDRAQLNYSSCVMCRRRKLKCDRNRPRCGLCSRLGKDCIFDTTRKRNGPKRKLLQDLDKRLTKVEELLKDKQSHHGLQLSSSSSLPENQHNTPLSGHFGFPSLPSLRHENPLSSPTQQFASEIEARPVSYPHDTAVSGNSSYSESNSLGLAFGEQLPSQDTIRALDSIFFEKVYPSIPIIHPRRFFVNSSLSAPSCPSLLLRYMIWCHASLSSDRYYLLHEEFYQRARKYAELCETTESFRQGIVSLSHCQAWILLSIYELRMVSLPRAWISVGKASSLSLATGLNQLDGPIQDVKMCIPPPKDWVEREERRRVFWMAFCMDLYASIGTGRPMVIDETSITTTLPASEQSFLESKPERTLKLCEIFAGEGASTLSSLAYVCVSASLLKRSCPHTRRIRKDGDDAGASDPHGQQHQSHDEILIPIFQHLPGHLRLPNGINDINVIFSNMCIHASRIWYHQEAIIQGRTCRVLDWFMRENNRRCLLAASQIASLLRLITDLDPLKNHTFMPFPLFLSAKIFVQHLKSQPDNPTIRSLLQNLVSTLNIMRSRNPLAAMFLSRLDFSVVPSYKNNKAASS